MTARFLSFFLGNHFYLVTDIHIRSMLLHLHYMILLYAISRFQLVLHSVSLILPQPQPLLDLAVF